MDSDTLQAEQERMKARNQKSESRPCHCFSHSGIEFERHFSVQEIAEMWGLGVDKIRELFIDEPGVIRIGNRERRGCRGYITLRIPASVVQGVHARLRANA